MIRPPSSSRPGELTWEIAELFPAQGEWSEGEYLRLDTKRLIELSDGRLEMLPMPTQWHQIIALFLYEQLREFTRTNQLGLTLAAPLRVQLWKGKMREPDVVFMLAANRERRGDAFWERADLVMEVVSDDDPDRDLVIKRAEYAKAGISEYWIVDPRDRTIRVLALTGEDDQRTYADASIFSLGEVARSTLLPGFGVTITDVFDESREF